MSQLAASERAGGPRHDDRRDPTPLPSAESLRTIGVFVVLPAEKQANDAVVRLKKLKRDYVAAVSKRRGLETEWAAISKRRDELTAQLKDADAAIMLQRQNDPNYLGTMAPGNPTNTPGSPGLPGPYVVTIVGGYAKSGPDARGKTYGDTTFRGVVGDCTGPRFPQPASPQQILAANLQMNRATIEADLVRLPTPNSIEQSRRRTVTDIESRRSKLKESVAHARPLVSGVVKDYEAVSRDPKAKAIVDEINRGQKRDQAWPV